MLKDINYWDIERKNDICFAILRSGNSSRLRINLFYNSQFEQRFGAVVIRRYEESVLQNNISNVIASSAKKPSRKDDTRTRLLWALTFELWYFTCLLKPLLPLNLQLQPSKRLVLPW